MININYSPVSNSCSNPVPPPVTQVAAATVAPASVELHACMGLNACQGHDRYGNNTCAGMGYCATAQAHTCHTLNNCHGQGGCGLYGSAEEQQRPAANECAWQGSCAVPIQAERFSTLGPNAGKSTWLLARKLFEERMAKARRNVGPAPFECGPPQSWLTSVMGTYDSCGNSGDKVCSFGFNNPATNGELLCEGKSIVPNEKGKK